MIFISQIVSPSYSRKKAAETAYHCLICVQKNGRRRLLRAAPCDPKLFYFQHPVADPDVRLNELRRIRIGFQLFAQRHHKDPERGYIIVPAPAPDMLRDKGMRQDFPGILGEKAEQLELDRSQLYLLSVQGRASCSIIDFQDSIRIYGTVRAASGVHDGKTPDRNAQTPYFPEIFRLNAPKFPINTSLF